MKVGKIPLDSEVTLIIRGQGKELQMRIEPISMGKSEEILLIEPVRANGVIVKFEGMVSCTVVAKTADGRDYSYMCKAITREQIDGKDFHAIYSEDDPKEINRRDCARIPFTVPAEINITGVYSSVKCFIRDISYDGLCIRIPNFETEVEVGILARCSFSYENLRFKAVGNIRRCKKLEDDTNVIEIGLQFNKESSKTLTELVSKIAREEVKKARKVRGLNDE